MRKAEKAAQGCAGLRVVAVQQELMFHFTILPEGGTALYPSCWQVQICQRKLQQKSMSLHAWLCANGTESVFKLNQVKLV